MNIRTSQPQPWLERTVGATLLALVLAHGPAAEATTVKIVGVAATSCAQFNAQVAQDPAAEQNFVAWAQGFMSGLVIRAPPGVDENLDLLPPTYPLARQTEFLRAFCRDHPDRDYTDGVLDLYRLLRRPPT